ncbi:MAG: DUF2726 domain-containing protein [Solirubrobacteraceae bacterium]
MEAYRRPILVSRGEQVVDGKLASLCQRFGARLFPKVRIADVLPVSKSTLADADFSYALKAHFDFVIADAQNEALLAVEFDGPSHYSDAPKVAQRRPAFALPVGCDSVLHLRPYRLSF